MSLMSSWPETDTSLGDRRTILPFESQESIVEVVMAGLRTVSLVQAMHIWHSISSDDVPFQHNVCAARVPRSRDLSEFA